MQICKHREMLAVVFGVERFHTYIYGQSFMIESDHKPLESISRKNLADMPAQLQCMMLCLQGYNLTIHYCPGKEMVIPDMLSWFIPWTGPNLPMDIAIHHAHIMPNCKEAFQQAFISDPEMWALTNLIISGWPENIKEVPHPLYPYWQHRKTLTIEDGLVLWGEALIIPPVKRTGSCTNLHQFHQGIMKSQLLACWSSFWPSINKAIEEVVCQFETCTQFQSQNAAAPLMPTPTPSCPWQMCATYIFMLEGVDYLVVGDFYLKMMFIWCLPPGQSNANKVVSLLKEMFSEHGILEVPLLWQWPTICECPICQLLYILGHNTQNLKSALPTIQWICWGMCEVHQICTPTSQVQQCQYTAHSASTPSYTHWHQASLPSRAIVPMPTQNNHSGQDLQQWPIIHTNLWADWHMFWSCQITGWQMQQNTCTTVCWSTSCNVWYCPTVIHVLPQNSY